MNNIKKIMTLVALMTLGTFYGQKKPDKEKIKALKVAFITERLDLSSKEAQTFWPLYNEYKENRARLRKKEGREVYSKLKESQNLSEKEADNILILYLKIEEEEEELDKAFIKKVSKVISSKRTLLLIRSEEEFKRQLIKQYRKKKGNERR